MRYLVWTLIAALCGIAGAYALLESGRAAYAFITEGGSSLVYVADTYDSVTANLAQVFSPLKRIVVERPEPPESGKAILADLTNLKLELYEDGKLVTKFDIAAKGRKGTPWETPGGNYAVLYKSEKHFSSIGKVWMPYSMQFFGNFFIHGWPYYEGGKEVPEGYSGGCIRLSTRDAEKVFDFAQVGTPVLVYGVSEHQEETIKHYERRDLNAKAPTVSARSYLVADLDSGEILAEKNPDLALPIASVSKLMTALVSLDAINQYQTVTISKRALATEGTSGNLKAGEQIEAGNLIYPLLLESSNDAAEALAEHYGRSQFIKLMNDKAKAIGLKTTSFTDPSGLSPQNVSTAADLYRLARYLDEHKPYVFDVSAKLGHSTVEHGWVNTNDLAAASYFLGGKNGFTDEARQTMLSLWSLPFSETENRRLVVITLGSQSRKKDAETLLAYIKKLIIFEPHVQAAKPLTLAFVGDIMLDRGVKKSVAKQAAGDYNWLFKQVGELAEGDLLFGNLEGPLSDQGADIGNLYSFRMEPKALLALKAAGFDTLTVANNHAGDWGLAAFEDSLNRLTRAGILVTGASATPGEFLPQITQVKGQKVGFLAASDVGPAWLAPQAGKAGVVLASDPAWPEAISRAAALTDVLVVSYHFGEEYQTEPNARQVELARLAIDHGAQLVIGHHPHVTQKVERYGDGLIAYSLGNFIFDQYFSTETMTGKALVVELEEGKIARWHEKKVALSPMFQPSLTSNEKRNF
jgi:D-alanyl-D-alanine carboxypeptidase